MTHDPDKPIEKVLCILGIRQAETGINLLLISPVQSPAAFTTSFNLPVSRLTGKSAVRIFLETIWLWRLCEGM